MVAEVPPLQLQNHIRRYEITADSSYLHNNFFPYDKKIARAMFKNKHVMFIGDSLTRAMYKDMISLIESGNMCTRDELRATNEYSFHGDAQIDILPLDMNRVFRQAREFQTNQHLFQFFFTSRCMRADIDKTFLLIQELGEVPDYVFMNSGIWDISRYHTRKEHSCHFDLLDEIETIDEYIRRLAMVCRRLRVLLPPKSKFVYMLMPLSAKNLKDRGFLHTNQFHYTEIRQRLMQANLRAASVVREAGFDVLDLSAEFRSSSHEAFRIIDGVHWNHIATRFMNQLLIGHLARASSCYPSVRGKFNRKLKDLMHEKFPRPHRINTYFDHSLAFLRRLNEGAGENEKLMQDLRRKILFRLEKDPKSSLTETICVLRDFHYFINVNDSMRNEFGAIARNFANHAGLNEDLGFSYRDIRYLCKGLTLIKLRWTPPGGIRFAQQMRKNLKRKRAEEEEKSRAKRIQDPVPMNNRKKSLLPTPRCSTGGNREALGSRRYSGDASRSRQVETYKNGV